ncbi:Uncharacterised protein [Vibrio cholerae]|uniref:Uncharacterized protein n=1 Tax=Vibrio cholerae TaxID=666 RepID=A0A655U0W8_VIBCL|nr:Uncharacterised protein [Vibrio cholerae]CSA45515.1 Uncharacterised protein [Vibrio cholerae]CSB42897.1 Uncharacterised protein [Vibrio cholerae]CSB99848.1 Uncharacterised protein [Vibrio cholerae]CSC77181.1 Uncharacterised protein [Vibrio cholerae]
MAPPSALPCGSSRRGARRSCPERGAALRWLRLSCPGSSFKRIERAIRLRCTSTSITLTLTMSPALTTSRGSEIKRSVSAEICTKPS